MKKILMFAVAVMAMTLTATAQDVELTNEEFVGSWSGSMMGATQFVTINADGTYEQKASIKMGDGGAQQGSLSFEVSDKGKWEIQDKKIILITDPESIEMSDPQINLPAELDPSLKAQIYDQVSAMKGQLLAEAKKPENQKTDMTIISYDGKKLIVEEKASNGQAMKITYRKKKVKK